MGVGEIERATEPLITYPKRQAREVIRSGADVARLGLIATTITSIFSPVVGAVVLALYLFWWLSEYEFEFFGRNKDNYELKFLPVITKSHYIQFAYEVYDDPRSLSEHLAIVKKKDFKELSRRAEEARRKRPYEVVGVSKDVLTRHLWILGATGAGKTSLIMRAFQAVFSRGGGAVFCDGKAEMAMGQKCYSLAYKEGREADFQVISFLKPEMAKEETNTYSPTASLPPSAQVEFLATLTSTGASGDHAYWEGRAKALLSPVIYGLSFRKNYYGEPYTFRNILNTLTTREYAFISTVLSALAVAFDRRLASDDRLSTIVSAAKTLVTPATKVETLEVLENYLVMYPFERETLRGFGYDPNYLQDLFKAYSNAIVNYAKTLSPNWGEALVEAGIQFEEFCNSQGFTVDTLPIRKLRELFEKWTKDSGKELADSILELPEKEMTQHGYSQQHWSNLFNIFEKYSHIFGSLEPEVDMLDVISNNKILYILLPVLELDELTSNVLGRSIVAAIRAASSVALGYKIHNLTPTQAKIIERLIKPTPLALVVLDEYGAYPVPGIDVILAQCRSIKVSVWLSTQDFTSARVGGKDENSVLRTFANTNKFILGIKDPETLRKASESVPPKQYLEYSSAVDIDGKHQILERTLQVKSKSPLEIIQEITKAETGFAYYLVDGRDGFMQIEWADEKAGRIRLNRFRSMMKRL